MLIFRWLLIVPLTLFPLWALIGGERSLASDVPLSFSSQSPRVDFSLVPQSEEIQEFVIAGLDKTAPVRRLEATQAQVVADVYFDERRLFVDAEMKAVFLQMVGWLVAEPQESLRIEGHCDPRGPSAYNFVRAGFYLANLSDYLSRLGISSHQISTVNYGQTPLLCRQISELCQEDNLRAENIFPILSVGNTQRGCLARLRFIDGEEGARFHHVSQRLPFLPRIHVASPSSSF